MITAAYWLLILIGCGKQIDRPFHRIGVVPFENLSIDRSQDWIGAVIPHLVAAQTVGAEKVLALRSEAGRDLPLLRASQAVRGYYFVERGTLTLHAELQDLDSRRTVTFLDSTYKIADAPLAIASDIATRIAGGSRKLNLTNPAALRPYGESLLEDDPGRRLELAQAAFNADSKLTVAAVNAAQFQIARGAAAEAREILRQAIAAQDSEWERSHAEALLAGIDRNRDLMLDAFRKAVKHSPKDADIMRQLADAALNKHQYDEAAKWLQQALALEPNQDVLWNALAYAQAYARDFNGALKSLSEYRKRAPQNPNTLDSTGEIHWMAGNFAGAEKSFLEAQQKDASFLGGLEFSKAAFARFLAGDLNGADAIHGKFIETRRAFQDPMVDVRHAHWFLLTGRHEKAVEQLARLAQGEGEVGSRAGVLLGMALLLRGKHDEAKAAVQKAASQARTAASLNVAGIVAFLAQPPASPAEWRSRADRAFAANAPPHLRLLLLAYAFTLGGHLADAAPVLERLFAEASPAANDEVRILLGGARLGAGDPKGAAALLTNHPLPPQTGDAVAAAIYFPRYLEWRKQALAKYPSSEAH